MAKYRALSLLVAGLGMTAQAVKLTNSDFDVAPGKDFDIEWADAQEPVTIKLKSGSENNLDTVETITSSGSGGSLTWSVPADLDSGDDYAFEIEDGSGDVNYSVQFPVDGDGSDADDAEPSESSGPTRSEEESTTASASDPVQSSASTAAPSAESSLSTRASESEAPASTLSEPSDTAEPSSPSASSAEATSDGPSAAESETSEPESESESASDSDVPDSAAPQLHCTSALFLLAVAGSLTIGL